MKTSGGGGVFVFEVFCSLVSFLVVRSRFFGLSVALEYCEHFLGLAVVLRESSVLKDHVFDAEEDNDREEEEGGLLPRRGEGLYLS